MAIEQSPRVRKVDTRRAVRAISAEFRSVGFSVGLCRPKFEVGDVLGSFRLSRGCGMVSRFPLYSFESPVIDGRFWESNRIFFGGSLLSLWSRFICGQCTFGLSQILGEL